MTKNKMNNLWIISYFLLLSFLPATGIVNASESGHEPSPDLTHLSIEELMEIEIATVYGASKYEQKVTEAPSSISIVTAEEIKKYGYRTLADILRSIRGFYITYDRNYSYVGTRGFNRPGDYNIRFLLLIDGHRINENIYDSISIGTDFLIDVDLIYRVEVIRGPGSSLYGSNAFFAVVNVITKQGQDLKAVEISGEAGSFDTYKGRLSYGNRFQNGAEAILSGSIYDSNGQGLYFKEFDDPAGASGTTHIDYDRYYSYFSKISYHDFTLEGAYVSRTKGIPTASYGTDFNDPRNKTVDSRGFIDLKYERNLSRQIDVMARLFYDYYDYSGDYIYGGVVNKNLGSGQWWGGEINLTAKVFEKHRVVFGTEYRNNMHQQQRNYNEDPFFLFLDDNRHSDIWALYIQDEFQILNNLIFNIGVRYDHYNIFGGTTNPRLSMIYKPFEKTIIKILYGEAFRAPNNFELYFTDGGITSKSNSNLKPEKIKTYELIYEQYIGEHFRSSLSGFYYKINDLISLTIDPADNLLVYRNVNEIEARGMELELEGRWSNGLQGRMSYTFQGTKDLRTGKILTNSPKHLAKLNLILPLIKEKIFAGIETQYTGRRKTLSDDNVAAFFITNLTLFTQNMIKGLEISGSIYNLFDKKYGDPGSTQHRQDVLEQDGRNFRLKLTYKF